MYQVAIGCKPSTKKDFNDMNQHLLLEFRKETPNIVNPDIMDFLYWL